MIDSTNGLFINIEIGIYKLIDSFYPKYRGFDLYSTTFYKVSLDGKIIGGADTTSCEGYLVFADMFGNDNGYNKGIHYWSVKRNNCVSCYRYIGIISAKDTKWIDLNHKGIVSVFNTDNIFVYLYPKTSAIWKEDNIVTIELDCNNWTLSFWQHQPRVDDKENNQDINDKKDMVTYEAYEQMNECFYTKIEPNQNYFLVMRLCANRNNSYEAMETPLITYDTMAEIGNLKQIPKT